jgi:hypothetical protein
MVWRTLDKSWHDISVEYCDVCGNLLIGKYWEFLDQRGEPIRACREDDEQLYGRLLVYRARAREQALAAGR